MYKALTVISLPVVNEDGDATGEAVRKEPGSEITARGIRGGRTDPPR
jgi:hypothetical protein